MDDIRKGRDILRAECERAGITPGVLQDAPHTPSYTAIRHAVLKRLREETSLSWREIGLVLGYGSRPSKQYYRLVREKGVIHTTTTTTSLS